MGRGESGAKADVPFIECGRHDAGWVCHSCFYASLCICLCEYARVLVCVAERGGRGEEGERRKRSRPGGGIKTSTSGEARPVRVEPEGIRDASLTNPETTETGWAKELSAPSPFHCCGRLGSSARVRGDARAGGVGACPVSVAEVCDASQNDMGLGQMDA